MRHSEIKLKYITASFGLLKRYLVSWWLYTHFRCRYCEVQLLVILYSHMHHMYIININQLFIIDQAWVIIIACTVHHLAGLGHHVRWRKRQIRVAQEQHLLA